MTYQTILFEKNDGVATITLNRPDTLNAFNDVMIRETTEAFKQCARAADVRCVVLTGAGRGFSSGQDLADVQNRAEGFSVGDHLRHGYHRLIKRMVSLEKPIIAAVNGVAAGAGCGVALAADIRIASEKASFILAFSRVGLIPDNGVNWFLPRLIGQARAYQMAITAQRVSAAQALEWGMVNEVAEAERFHETVNEWAQRLASGPSLAFGLTKRAMNRAWDQTLAEALNYEAYLQETAAQSQDYREGVQAFLEKRAPRFAGK
ncbi:MAG: 2-(1,2-epoxy-1,2-dihydrophenyl)acetyl-CoA isomerase [Chloroflexi bacterium]|nr:2-(1,2-epoxy-1,2-dihydrophenyl)acetyl-CoA isomerase [Chloroflexota bacterium]